MTVDGSPIWLDLACDDIEKSKMFYSSVLGWSYENAHPDAGGWTAALAGGSAVAGLAARRAGTPSSWSVYFAASDADAMFARCIELGATPLAPCFNIEIAGELQGRIAAVADPTGGAFGLWQPAAMRGLTPSGAPGHPQWFELNSSAPATAIDFYTRLFGASATNIGDPSVPDYVSVTVTGSEHENFGIWRMPEMLADESASQWFPYFAVRGVDATTEAVDAGGGNVIAIEDSMHGRWAYCIGTQGEQFYLIDPTVKVS